MKNKETSRVVNIEGRKIPVRIRQNTRARRMILRVDKDIDGAVVTLPSGISEREALLMVQDKSDWLLTKLDNMPSRILFESGIQIPILGEYHTVCHDPNQKEIIKRGQNEIRLGGREEHLSRRLGDWLRKEAKIIIQPKAIEMAKNFNGKIGRISIRDTKSRWGSCAASGNLSFCWRLILTPEWVLNYVIAHEVSHLRHMNHGSEFWQTVADFNVRVDAARVWLSKNTEQLHRYG
jgi:predicted metal-dependent hydrolase